MSATVMTKRYELNNGLNTLTNGNNHGLIRPVEHRGNTVPDITYIEQPGTSKYMNYEDYLTNHCIVPRFPDLDQVKFNSNQLKLIAEYTDLSLPREVRLKASNRIHTELLHVGSCSAQNPSTTPFFRSRLFSLDPVKLSQQFQNSDTYDYSVQANTSCMIDSIVNDYDPDNLDKNKIHSNERVVKWFPHIKMLASGAHGQVFSSSLDGGNEMVAIKTSLYSGSDLKREAVIGMYCTNNLRKYVPNFAFVYGYTECSSLAPKGNNQYDWCSTLYPSASYLYMEKIKGKTFRAMLEAEMLDKDAVWSILVQVVNALNVAFKQSKFVHFDLHADNVMIVDHQQPIAVPYYDNEMKIAGYIVSRYVPVIIDYGYAAFSMGGARFYYIPQHKDVDMSPGYYKINPMNDLYTLFGTSTLATHIDDSRMPTNIMDDARHVINSFNRYVNRYIDADLVKIYIETQSSLGEINPEVRDSTVQNFIDWLTTKGMINKNNIYSYSQITQAEIKILPRSLDLTVCQFFDYLKNPKANITNNFDLCEAVNAVESDSAARYSKENIINFITSRHDAEAEFLNSLPNVDVSLQELDQNLQKYGVDINGLIYRFPPNFRAIDLESQYAFYSERVYLLPNIKHLYAQLQIFVKTSRCALTYTRKLTRDNIDKLQQLQEYVDEMERILSNSKVQLQYNQQFIDEYIGGVRNQKIVNFWIVEYPAIVASLP